MSVGDIGLYTTGIGGFLNATSNVLGGYNQQAFYKGLSNQKKNQIGLNNLATANQIDYDASTTAYQIRSIMSKGEQLFGRQKTTLARAGDTTGATARAIVKDSARKQAEDIAMLEYRNELAGFERRRQTELENISLEAESKMARLAGDNAVASGWLRGGASLLSTIGTVASSWYGLNGSPSTYGTGINYIGGGRTWNSNASLINRKVVL